MDSQRLVFDSVKAEKANAMRHYRWRQNLRWLWKACLLVAPLSYVLCRDAPRQLLIAVFNSNLCVFLLLNALVVVTCVLSGENVAGSDKSGGVTENDIYGEYVANVESTRRSDPVAGFKGSELVNPEAEEGLAKEKEIGCFVSHRSMVAGYQSPAETETAISPEEVSNFQGTESYENVNVESLLPVCEDKAVTECKIVVSSVSAVTTSTSGSSGCGEESEKVKGYRRTQSESFEKKRKEPKRGLQRSKTKMEDLSAEEFQRQIELFITANKFMIQMLEEDK